MRRLTKSDVEKEVEVAESELREPDGRAIRLWDRMRIAPERWSQEQYPSLGPFWVVAVIGYRCLYYNEVEGGWGWGRYEQWGKIGEYHCNDNAIHHIVFQTMVGIDEGGVG